MSKVFISYARDASVGEKLATEAQMRLQSVGHEVFRDVTNLNAGERWDTRLEIELEASDIVVLILSEKVRLSTWVHNEISRAKELGIPIIPIFSELIVLPLWLIHLQALDFSDKAEWNKLYAAIAHHIKTINEKTLPPSPLMQTEKTGLLSQINLYKWKIIGITGSFVLLSLIYSLLTPPIYRATTSLHTDPDTQHYELLRSRPLARRVINNLGIDRKEIEHNLFTNFGKTKITSEEHEENFFKQLKTQQSSNKRLLNISFDNSDPRLAADISNEVARTFIRMVSEEQFNTSLYKSEAIKEKIRNATVRLEQSEKKLRAYMKDKKNLSQNQLDQDINYKALNREVTTNNRFLDRLYDSNLEHELIIPRSSVKRLDKAGVPSHPHKPDFFINLCVGLVTGLLLSITSLARQKKYRATPR